MSYIKQNFSNGDVLKHTHLNHIEDGIVDLSYETDVKLKSLEDLIYELANQGVTSFSWLSIGNSFARDTLFYAYQLAEELGFTDIHLGILYIGNCTIQTHINNITNNTAAYTYDLNTSGVWTSTANYTIKSAVESREWDIISLQQASGTSGVASSYDDVPSLLSTVKGLVTNSPKYVWLMTWAYSQDSTHNAFPTYNNDQMVMYNAIINAVQTKIVPMVNSGEFYTIIPSGTAIQNARTSILGDELDRDGYHLHYGIGRYTSGIAALKSSTKKKVDGITYVPNGEDMGVALNGGTATNYVVAPELRYIAIESANNAHVYPFSVTESKYKSYADIDWTKSAYWWSTESNPAGYENMVTTEITTQTNQKYFWCTQKFTKEDLPVGSLIVLSDGYSYRPEGWLESGANTSNSRPANTNENIIEITDAWWGSYTCRAFNVFKGTAASEDISSMAKNDLDSVFKIILYK